MSLINDDISSSPLEIIERDHFLRRLSKWKHIALPIASIAIIVLALFILQNLLWHTSRRQTIAAIDNIPLKALGLALFFTIVSYAAIALYDVVAVHTIAPRRIPHWLSGVTGAAGYAISNALGFSLLTGGILRYRIYASEGISLADISRIVSTSWFSIWFSLIFMIGGALLIDPIAVPWLAMIDPHIGFVIGGMILVGMGWFIYWLSKGARTLIIGRFTLRLPSSHSAIIQIAAGLIDIVAAAATLYVLMPNGIVSNFSIFTLIYVIAIFLGMASHAPGGLGAFEVTIIAGLGLAGKPDALAGLLVYRLIYTVIPLLVAVGGVFLWEVVRRRNILIKHTHKAVRLIEPLIPALAASITFLGGIILLLSGVTPTMDDRLDILSDILPLPFVEVSHLVSSFIGIALLIIARGLAKRLTTAWIAALLFFIAGAIFSLTKGIDWEEASALCVFAIVLWVFRGSFYRSPIADPFELTWNWITSIATTVFISIWLGFFVYRHVEYSNSLWWEFAWNDNASRFLRSSIIVLAVIFIVSFNTVINRRGLKKNQQNYTIPSIVPQLVAESCHTDSALAFLGDKQFLMAPDDRGFVMYARSGRSLIAFGEPIGDKNIMKDLAWSFHELADRLAMGTVFYGVGSHSLPLFLDMGLVALKLGEVAHVNLYEFSLESPACQPFRYASRRADKEGITLEIIPAAQVTPLMPRLKTISDHWLDFKSGSEKRFSLGFFDPDYLSHFDMAVMKKEGEIVAFANLWRAAGKHEISIDLMRYMPNSFKLIMDAFFAKLLMACKTEGYHWFNLGAAPLSGLSGNPLASHWNRFGSFIYKHGVGLYHFDGLKSFKEKFDPLWSPHYLICPGGLATLRTLIDVTTLINGNLLGFIRK